MKELYEDHAIRVFTNGSGEIFVEHKASRVTTRISPDTLGILVTAHDGTLIPWAINGLSAIRVYKKYSS